MVDVVVALVNVAPGGSPVQGQGEARVSVHGPGHKVLLVNIWVLDGFIQQQLPFLHGPVLHHVQVVDVEVAGQVARHPDVVNPEEPDEMYPALSSLAPIIGPVHAWKPTIPYAIKNPSWGLWFFMA